MIRRIGDIGTLYGALGERADVYTEKIRSLADAYGFGYGFCGFWAQDGGAVIGSYYGDACIADCGSSDKAHAAELAQFISCGQFAGALMPYPLSERLELDVKAEKCLLMKARNDIKKTDDIDKVLTGKDISIGEIYEIAKTGFDIDFNKWYTDTSHMLRHGSAQLYALGKSSCAVKMFGSRGTVYLSYICTLPEERGKGLAGKLLAYICARETENGNSVFLFCGEELKGFYESAGFEHFSDGAQIYFRQ